jgi:hypothetical protein
VIHREQAEDVIHRLEGMSERAYKIGVVERQPEGGAPLVFEAASGAS